MEQEIAELLCLSTPVTSGPKGFSLSLPCCFQQRVARAPSWPWMERGQDSHSAARGTGGEGSQCLQVTNCNFAW